MCILASGTTSASVQKPMSAILNNITVKTQNFAYSLLQDYGYANIKFMYSKYQVHVQHK